MRFVLIIFCVFIIAMPAYAGEILKDRALKDLKILRTDRDGGRAVITFREGEEKEIEIGDRIGSEGAEVVKIGRSSIRVRMGGNETIIPSGSGFDITQ